MGEPKFCPGYEICPHLPKPRTSLNCYDQGLTLCLASTTASRCDEGSPRCGYLNHPSLELGVAEHCRADLLTESRLVLACTSLLLPNYQQRLPGYRT